MVGHLVSGSCRTESACRPQVTSRIVRLTFQEDADDRPHSTSHPAVDARAGAGHVVALFQAAHADLRAAGPGAGQTPNYVLASQWTTAKINKVVFDLSVKPHWLETGDRFWYSYETRDGKRYFLVDPVKKTKAPLFDNAKMAAMLTSATLVPMDAQHLPIKTIKAIKNDTALLLEVEVPKNADIPGVKTKPPERTTTSSQREPWRSECRRRCAAAAPGAARPRATMRTAIRSRCSSSTTSAAAR